MEYYICVTINTDKTEYEHLFPYETSLDAAMARILEMYPTCTSVVMSIVPIKVNANE